MIFLCAMLEFPSIPDLLDVFSLCCTANTYEWSSLLDCSFASPFSSWNHAIISTLDQMQWLYKHRTINLI